MSILSKLSAFGLGAMLAASAALPATAQSYPTKPVTFVIPFGAGGAVDIVGRVVGDALGKKLGQRIVIDNRAGATGNIAIDHVAKSAPDGYTLLFSNSIPVVVNPVLTTNFPVVIADAYVPVAKVGDANAYLLAVHPSVPVKTVAELIAYTKANPGKINYASGGNGSINQLAMELFKTASGADLTHIPYQAGAAAATNAVLGNEAQAIVGGVSTIAPHAQSGALRVLAVTSPARIAQLPDVPTLKEAGVGGESFSIWYGILAPKNTPPAVVATLNSAVNAVLQDPAVKDAFTKQGIEIAAGTPEDFGKLVTNDGAIWKEVAKKAKLTGQ